ncbi:hypothetical protein Avbf_17814 [Armadillidium vulgare]|nr:hypothetical protein Avbf_17814 [Armadillidium vulgare]
MLLHHFSLPVPAFGIPKRVANRMIPSWWFTVTAKMCATVDLTVGEGECCARPMLSPILTAFPLKKRQYVLMTLNQYISIPCIVYFSDCPCEKHLNCVGLEKMSICMNLRNFEDDLQHLTSYRKAQKD